MPAQLPTLSGLPSHFSSGLSPVGIGAEAEGTFVKYNRLNSARPERFHYSPLDYPNGISVADVARAAGVTLGDGVVASLYSGAGASTNISSDTKLMPGQHIMFVKSVKGN